MRHTSEGPDALAAQSGPGSSSRVPADESRNIPNRASAQVRVLNLRKVQKNSLRAFFDVELPSGLIIRDATLQFSHGKYWVGLPARPFENSEGVKSWTPVIDFKDKATKAKFQELVTAAAVEAFEAAAEGRGA